MNLPFIKARCEGWEAFLARAREYDLLQALKLAVCGELIEAAALAYGQASSAATLFPLASRHEARTPSAPSSIWPC